MKRSSVSNTNYYTQIPFAYYHNLIFVEVEIQGEKYNFFLDTGAEISVVGQHIIDKMAYGLITSSKVSSTSSTKRKYEFIELPKISIGSVDFENIGAITADFSHFKMILGCEDIDGIIGNNMMRKAIWQIDYTNKTLLLTDDFEKLIVSPEAAEIVMNSNDLGNVHFDVEIDGVKSKFTFDTGFTGKIKSDKQFLDKLILNNEGLAYTKESGITGININEVREGSTYNALVSKIDMEGLIVNDQIIDIQPLGSSLVGNKFFENYIMTLDWETDRLFLDLTTEIVADTLWGFGLGLSPNYFTNKIEVFNLQDDYPLDEPVSLGSEITRINNTDVADFNTAELCDYWEQEKESIRNNKTLKLLLLDNGVSKEVVLTRKALLPKK